jgi:multimeric flavodoxin WrbA
MKILGVLGSPRKGGNTETLLDIALEEAQGKGVLTEKIALRGKAIAPCDGCEACVKTGKCTIQDNAQEIYKAMLESDGIVWATPVYFWSMTSQTKTMMDRTYALLYPELQLASKVGGVILVAGNRGSMNAASVFNQYFIYNHMLLTEYAYGYATKKGEIVNNDIATNMAREMVNQMISLIKSNFKFPKEFTQSLPRHVRKKYSL